MTAAEAGKHTRRCGPVITECREGGGATRKNPRHSGATGPTSPQPNNLEELRLPEPTVPGQKLLDDSLGHARPKQRTAR